MGIITLIDEREQNAGRQHTVGAGQQQHMLTPNTALPSSQWQRWPVPHAPMSPALPRCLRGVAAL